MRLRYLDHNAGTPLGPAARAAMTEMFEAGPGNPSSIHVAGRAARGRLETARRRVAALVGAAPEDLVFCSGGTEAIALGVGGLARGARTNDPARTRILVGASEHPAAFGAAEAMALEGFSVERMPVDAAARLRLADVRLDRSVALVVLSAANHETGVVQPFEALAAEAAAAGAPILCDAVQAAGKRPISLERLGASALCLSSHKLYGPTGAGALALAPGVRFQPAGMSGHQERGRRPGTEPSWALVGFGAAAAEAAALVEAEATRQHELRARLEAGLVALGAVLFAAEAERLPNTSLCAFPGARGQLLVMALDLAGFAVSTGAACSSGSLKPSTVLLAAGHDEARALEAVRISIGRDTTGEDVDALLEALPPIATRVRAASSGPF